MIKITEELITFFNEFSSFLSHINNAIENIINPSYYDVNQLQTLKKFIYESSLSLFHWNTCSLSKNIDDLEKLTDIGIIAVSESRIVKNKLPLIDTRILNYNYEFCQGKPV